MKLFDKRILQKLMNKLPAESREIRLPAGGFYFLAGLTTPVVVRLSSLLESVTQLQLFIPATTGAAYASLLDFNAASAIATKGNVTGESFCRLVTWPGCVSILDK